MKLHLESTPQITVFNGAPCRVWKGIDGTGVEVLAFIAAVSPQTHDERVAARYAGELLEVPERFIVGPGGAP